VSKQKTGEQKAQWCDVPYVIDDAITELFEMPAPDTDPGQEPSFHVTSSTADLVEQDFELYKPSLERMAKDWKEEKARFMQERAGEEKGGEK
jgi:hypothetical protein